MDKPLKISGKKFLKILELNENENRNFKTLQDAMKEAPVGKII